jgi:hypothetical protein
MKNGMANFALLFETALVALISYIKPLEIALGTRAVASAHFSVCCMAYFAIVFFFDESRKILLRKGVDKSQKGKIRYPGWVARNTFW